MNELFEYLITKGILSEENINTIKRALAEIHEDFPGDKFSANSKNNRLIECSEDLSWIVFVVKKFSVLKNTEYNKAIDTMYTTLVRQNRPSSEAIHCEIRFKNPLVYSLEEDMKMLEITSQYLDHIEQSIKNYMYMMKFKFEKEVI